MESNTPHGWSARRRGAATLYRMEVTTSDADTARVISDAAAQHGQSVPAFVLGAARSLATGSDGASISVARCLPSDALMTVLLEREANPKWEPEVVDEPAGLSNCRTCAFAHGAECRFEEDGDDCETFDAVFAWCREHVVDCDPVPGATGCPGWRGRDGKPLTNCDSCRYDHVYIDGDRGCSSRAGTAALREWIAMNCEGKHLAPIHGATGCPGWAPK